MNELLKIESLDVNKLPELQGMREKQLQIVKDNPFIEITDNKTFDAAKKARTTLLTARTDIQNQDKAIASKIQEFRKSVSVVSEELISITRPHEEKQQQEVKRWEKVKEDEKQEKLRQEEERKNNIKDAINGIIDEALLKITKCSFETIDSLRVDFEEGLYKTDLSQFEEFEIDFNEKLIQVKNSFSSKIKTLQESEAQRLEKLRLEAEAKKLEEEKLKMEEDRKAANEKAAADRKAEEDRLAKIKADQEAELEAERKKIADQKAKQDADLAEQQAKIDAENKKLQDEKDRLEKIESDRIAKEKAEQDAKNEAERKAKEAAENEARAKAEAERLELLKPEKQKVVEYLESIKGGLPKPEITDEKLKVQFLKSLERIQDSVSDAITAIKNFK